MIQYPSEGKKIVFENGVLKVPDNPIVGFIKGDGIGPEVMYEMRRVIDHAVEKSTPQRKIFWCDLPLGEGALKQGYDDIFPQETEDALRDLGVSIKGPLTTPIGSGFRSLNVSIRQRLDLYACVRPVKYYKGVPSPCQRPQDLDVVIFRENTEDIYSGIEYQACSKEAQEIKEFLESRFGAKIAPNSALGVKPVSEAGSKRLIRMAMRYALAHQRDRLTLVHKGNIMKFTEGAFMNWGYELAKQEFAFDTIAEADLKDEGHGDKVIVNDRICDITFQLLLLRPKEFSVIATTNLNGDYLSDAAAAQVGGIGIAPGANMNEELAVFEATHGSAPKYAGLNMANPSSVLLSAVMMLRHLGWQSAAERVESAFAKTIEARIVTYDFARQMSDAHKVSTSGFADALVERI